MEDPVANSFPAAVHPFKKMSKEERDGRDRKRIGGIGRETEARIGQRQKGKQKTGRSNMNNWRNKTEDKITGIERKRNEMQLETKQ